jgi:hypothetical protein
MVQIEQSPSIWVPGRFTPKPASGAERFWVRYSPPGWELLPYLALIIPGALFEYAISSGHRIGGAIGLLVWAPILWLLLVTIHQEGRVRIWFSAPVVLLAHFAIGLFIAGAL